jgi:spermidine/putrescine transport system permease protein
MNKKTPRKPKLMFTRVMFGIPYIVFLVIFVVFPLLLIVFFAFTDKTYHFTISNFLEFFTEPTNFKVFFLSVLIALGNTFLCILIGYPVAYLLATKKYNKSKILVLLFIMPMWINFVLRTGATKDMIYWLSPITGISTSKTPYVTIMIGMVYNYLPFTIMPLYSVMIKMDKSLVEASHDLGANNFNAFVKVIIPLSLPGVLSAVTMVFMPTMSSYVIATVMSERNVQIIGSYIQSKFDQGMWNSGSAVSLIMLLMIAISMLSTKKLAKEENVRGSLW